MAETEVVPAVNQIEAHPYLTQEGLLEFGARHEIATQAWSPLARGGALLADPVIEAVAPTMAARRPRWCCGGTSSAAASSFRSPARRGAWRRTSKSSIFALSEEDMNRISALDRHERTGPDPDTYNVIPE